MSNEYVNKLVLDVQKGIINGLKEEIGQKRGEYNIYRKNTLTILPGV